MGSFEGNGETQAMDTTDTLAHYLPPQWDAHSHSPTHILPWESPSYRSGCSTGSAKRRKCRNAKRKSKLSNETGGKKKKKKRSAEKREVHARF